MTENIAVRKFVDKGAAHIQDTSEKMSAATEETTKLIENTYATASNGIRDYNVKALEIARVNSDAAFDYVQQLMSAKSPSEMVRLWTAFASKQCGALTEQTKELAMLGQRVVTKTSEPIVGGVTKAFNKAA